MLIRPATLLLIAAALLPAPVTRAAPTDPAARADITTRLDRAIQHTTAGGYWGVALVARGDEIFLHKPYGFADYSSTPNTLDTLFEIASVSKPFTATAVYRMQMDGLLNIHDPIGKHLPALTAPHAEITIHQLLTHTAGLDGDLGLPYASTATRAEFIEHIQSRPLVTKPGSTYAYSNVGYALLAAIIEEVADQPFEQYLRERIFLPAGMTSTGFINDPHLADLPASSRRSERDPDSTATAVEWHWGWGYRGMGGVVTTAADLHAWSRALDDGAILDEESLDEIFTPNLNSYASGWAVTTTSAGAPVQMHTGRVEGFAAILARFPEDDTLIVLLTNDAADLASVSERINQVLFPRPTITATIDVGERQLDEYHAVHAADWTWRVTTDTQSAGIILTLVDPGTDETIARVTLPEKAAHKLAAELRGCLSTRTAETEPSTDEHGIYLFAFDARAVVNLDELQLRAMPSYSGVDENGETVRDPRITLIAVDPATRSWPIMSRLSDDSAVRLADELELTLIE